MTKSRALPLLLGIMCLASCSSAPGQTAGLMQFYSSGKVRTGITLAEFAHEVLIMGRDGWIHTVDPSNPKSRLRPLGGSYQPSSAVEMRNQLRKEFGPDFEVVATSNFLVVQPEGRGDRWPKLFETSHRSFLSYMKKRGVKVREGRFPMVAIVFPDEAAMYAEFRKQDIDVSRVFGLYSGDSNRVMTHDGGHRARIAATVRHEAAHQSAFNSGVHSRVNVMPRWITEGIGQMFEAPDIAKAGSTSPRQRVNEESLHYILGRYKGRNDQRLSNAVMQLVGGDALFENEKKIDEAYNVAWAMMFYLAERKPKSFARLLNHTASRPAFQSYRRAERIKDFQRITGSDPLEFSRQMSWYLYEL